jgi:hypothetical protein
VIVTRRQFLRQASAIPLGAAVVALKPTDIRCRQSLGYEARRVRAPYKFGGRVADRVCCAVHCASPRETARPPGLRVDDHGQHVGVSIGDDVA